MAAFTPPTDNVVPPVYVGPGAERGHDMPSHYADTTPGMQKLMGRYVQRPRGRNVFLMADGSVTEEQPPNWNPADPSGPIVQGWDPFTHSLSSTSLPASQVVVKVYWGGSANPVTSAEVATLTAAGYGAYIT